MKLPAPRGGELHSKKINVRVKDGGLELRYTASLDLPEPVLRNVQGLGPDHPDLAAAAPGA